MSNVSYAWLSRHPQSSKRSARDDGPIEVYKTKPFGAQESATEAMISLLETFGPFHCAVKNLKDNDRVTFRTPHTRMLCKDLEASNDLKHRVDRGVRVVKIDIRAGRRGAKFSAPSRAAIRRAALAVGAEFNPPGLPSTRGTVA